MTKPAAARKSPKSALAADVAAQVERMRSFNRFYTHKIGLLEGSRLYDPFSLAETRVLYELAHRDRVTASDLVRDLGMDAGYLSRMLRGFEKQGLITRKAAKEDARQSVLTITAAGRKAFAPQEDVSRRVLSPLIERLPAEDRARLVEAMDTITQLLSEEKPAAKPGFHLRPHRPGDIGWMVQKHGELYTAEYGWDSSFEALAAEVGTQFLRDFDPAWENAWIAELDSGERVGCVFLIRKSATVAKLRVLIVDPKARGLGVGKALVQACIDFAKLKGYRKITLWTNSILVAARGIYEKTGFRLVQSEPHDSFGQKLIGETWDLKL
ncbi:MarR family transcriptional regulator [Ferrovibrio terrae]|uniref:MarR family transcriptional regulator n=1 Tax=Ferrovibrio terrae TaxID=2594003 RepID=A0A516GZE2_9PROT|nr:helix-turn-helix domain-containing GNAT family N-acetyltransferase [Ferrovibrio terrae]QDO96865.1 MarR family transcriptional regulator [Ferrovibrio terrae]